MKRKHAYVVFVLCAATAMVLPAQTLTTLFSFDYANGAYPVAALVQGIDGSLYGTTSGGGANCADIYECGTAFQITPSGTLTTIYNFCSNIIGCPDGESPTAAIVQVANGDLYGTTVYGGLNANCPVGCGTIFRIAKTSPNGTRGKLTTLHAFCSQGGCPDGEWPYAGLVQAANGDFYGTTENGGAYGYYGTVFKITPDGTLTTLYSFCPQGYDHCTDGEGPNGLVQAANGDFYGTTGIGGANSQGTVFKITPSGTLTTLYSFCSQSGCTDGQNPSAGLVQATDGDLYGTTSGSVFGPNYYGTVFKITPSGKLTTLYTFCSQSGCTDGQNPRVGLVQATDGNFYGTTPYGGANCADNGGCGTVFKITPSGTLTTLYSFCSQTNCTDGEYPQASLVQATDGNFYGTTYNGGTDNDGTVFSLSVGLGPFVETQTTSGEVGTAVRILGTDLTGATSVSFNGTAAVFKVISSSLITATVPAGATSGPVQVVTPSGTLSSNAAFRVLP